MTLSFVANSQTGFTVYHTKTDRKDGFNMSVGNISVHLTEAQAELLADYLNKDRVGA